MLPMRLIVRHAPTLQALDVGEPTVVAASITHMVPKVGPKPKPKQAKVINIFVTPANGVKAEHTVKRADAAIEITRLARIPCFVQLARISRLSALWRQIAKRAASVSTSARMSASPGEIPGFVDENIVESIFGTA